MSRMVREGLIAKLKCEQRLKEAREPTMQLQTGKACQAEGTESAKALSRGERALIE